LKFYGKLRKEKESQNKINGPRLLINKRCNLSKVRTIFYIALFRSLKEIKRLIILLQIFDLMEFKPYLYYRLIPVLFEAIIPASYEFLLF
jgi:hypothetical protein